MDNNNVHGNKKISYYDARAYALSGKIMLIAIIVLFIFVVIMLCIHVYIRWYLVPTRRHTRRSSRPRFVFYVDASAPIGLTLPPGGLDAAVISSLPVFTFSSETHPETKECAVCLSEFEDGETGRILPQCDHNFHIDCIDMWLHSHSTCPLCRAPVEPEPERETRADLAVAVCESEPGSSSEACATEELNRSGTVVCSPSLVGVTVEVPGGSDESFKEESGCESFRLPMSQVLSLKRIISREWKATGCAAGCSSVSELDSERVGREETQRIDDVTRS